MNIFLLINLLVLIFSGAMLQSEQTPWHKETAQGFTIYEEKLETTEGFGAYMDFCLRPNSRNFDNGGGTYNYNSEFLKVYQGVTNIVYDPFMRDLESNKQALSLIEKHDFDTATSNSVLNVIDSEEARIAHISLSCKALKEGGIAYFKVWQGNGSKLEDRKKGSYQSNRPAITYQDDVESVFGRGNVVVDNLRSMLIAYKNSNCKS